LDNKVFDDLSNAKFIERTVTNWTHWRMW